MIKDKNIYSEKKVWVIGLGISGCSAAHFLIQAGALVTAFDDKAHIVCNRPEVQDLMKQGMVLKQSVDDSQKPDLVVISPGVPPANSFIQMAKSYGVEVIGEIELACRNLPCPMVGITGTNGKTTTTLLTTHILKQNGFDARALGNSGVSLTSLLVEENADLRKTILVTELSSYQIETLKAVCLDAAVILNITPDHLDRYESMEQYAKAKLRLQTCLKAEKPFYVEQKCASIYFVNDAYTYGYSPNCYIYTDLKNVFVHGDFAFTLPENLQNKESHEIENLLASYALCQNFGVTGEQFLSAYKTFQKPPHRIEWVRNHQGVTYINDSKGTNLDAVIRAVESIEGDVILIAGGVDKGAAYTPWINAFSGKVRCICAIGEARDKIKADLESAIPVINYINLAEAVFAASKEAKLGDTVLLSPGCSSYDMFKDYAHRGEEFKRLVQAI